MLTVQQWDTHSNSALLAGELWGVLCVMQCCIGKLTCATLCSGDVYTPTPVKVPASDWGFRRALPDIGFGGNAYTVPDIRAVCLNGT
jgi:hypothetical protein